MLYRAVQIAVPLFLTAFTFSVATMPVAFGLPKSNCDDLVAGSPDAYNKERESIEQLWGATSFAADIHRIIRNREVRRQLKKTRAIGVEYIGIKNPKAKGEREYLVNPLPSNVLPSHLTVKIKNHRITGIQGPDYRLRPRSRTRTNFKNITRILQSRDVKDKLMELFGSDADITSIMALRPVRGRGPMYVVNVGMEQPQTLSPLLMVEVIPGIVRVYVEN